MNTATTAPRLMTSEELLVMPDDGVDRWLIRGQLREARPEVRGALMTVRNGWHSRTMARIARWLDAWVDEQPQPRGMVLCGEVGCRLRRDPETTVGIDVTYLGPELAAQEPEDTRLIDGVPVLAVEILSPSDTVEDINEKIDEYLAAGVALVWVVDPHDQTVMVYRPGQPPTMVNNTQELSGEPHLPGFRVPVARLFAR